MNDPDRVKKFRRCKEERPGQLMEAALSLFAERGFAATRLADVGSRAGVSPGTVCLYFPTKQALFTAVIQHYIVPEVQDQHAILSGPGSPRERLIALMRAKAEELGRPHYASLAKLVMAESSAFPDIGQDFHRTVIEPTLARLAQVIEEGITCGQFRRVDPRLHARLLIDPLVFDAISRVSIGRFETDALDSTVVLEAYLTTALRGIDLHPDGEPSQ